MLSKYKENGDAEFTPIYINCSTKTVTNSKYMLDHFFPKILHWIDNCINEGSGWVIESVSREYDNIFIFSPLSGSRCIELSCRLRNAMKGLINVNSDNKLSLWCHIKPLNSLKIDPEKIAKAVKIMVNNLDYFLFQFSCF